MALNFRVRGPVVDDELTALHEAAFDEAPTGSATPWTERLARHSITWVTAVESDSLVGFINVVGDGGTHAFLLDTVVSPACQSRGIGRRLVAEAEIASRSQGCEWLHVDYEPTLADFYERVCGFRKTDAGLRDLRL